MNYIDTEKLVEKAKRIDQIANEYNNLVNRMFLRLTDVPYRSKEWIGDISEQYAKFISLDKENFLNFGKNIKIFSTYLKNVGNKSDEIINRVKKNEGQ